MFMTTMMMTMPAINRFLVCSHIHKQMTN